MFVVAMLPPLLPVSMLVTPSIVMLLEFGRWPFTVKPAASVAEPPWRVPPLSAWGSTPGTRPVKPKSERPSFAMFLIVSLSSAKERSPLVDCSSVTRARTLTSSDISPTCSVIAPALNLSFGATTTLVLSIVLKPVMTTRIR
jgi:hypothetical protein